MSSKALVSFLTVGVLSLQVALSEVSEGWKYYQILQLTGQGVTELPLSPGTVDKGLPDFRDIRICDSDGSEAPYVLSLPHLETGRLFPVEAVDTQVTRSETVVQVTTGTKDQIEAVIFETPAPDFLKVVQVEGSGDRRAWRVIARNRPIFHQPDGSNNLRVSILPGSWSYLRIFIDDRVTPPIPVSAVKVLSVSVESLPATRYSLETRQQSELPQESKLYLRLPYQNVYLASIEIVSPDSIFKRKVRLSARSVIDGLISESDLGAGTLYRFSERNLDDSENLTLTIHRQVASRELVLTVQNGDSPPLEITEVYAHVTDPSLIFYAREKEPRYLLIGNSAAKRPDYDISVLKKRSLPSRKVLAEAGPLQENPNHVPIDPFSEISATGKAINLQGWAYRKSVIIEHPGVQRLELDPEILSRSDPSGQDLRLVRDSHQIPFLLDQTGVTLELLPKVEELETQDSQLSRWAIDLGNAHLPISHLTCLASETLFRRNVILYEEAEDARGRKQRRRIGGATWVRSPEYEGTTLRIIVTRRPLTRRLFLEVDNGDNLPLSLEKFRFYYQTTRLIFKADSESPLWIYYGNPDASRPQYDIGLIAAALFSADKVPAALDKGERLEEASWWKIGAPTGVVRWFFWLCLGVAVFVLLFVIAKLLPTATETGDRSND